MKFAFFPLLLMTRLGLISYLAMRLPSMTNALVACKEKGSLWEEEKSNIHLDMHRFPQLPSFLVMEHEVDGHSPSRVYVCLSQFLLYHNIFLNIFLSIVVSNETWEVTVSYYVDLYFECFLTSLKFWS